jgi:hypothetical protein
VVGALGRLEADELGQVDGEDAAVEEDDGAEGWFCVEADVWRLTARWFKKAVTSAAPRVLG